jgi:hypothetical protein
MIFRLPDEAFDRLREKEVANGRLDSTSIEHDALWLHTDMGPVYYLTRDGRVLSEDVILETPIEEAPQRAALSALILGAKHLDAPELLSLLPSRPVGVPDCVGCSGSGRWKLSGETSRPRATILCPECAGLGWVSSREDPLQVSGDIADSRSNGTKPR